MCFCFGAAKGSWGHFSISSDHLGCWGFLGAWECLGGHFEALGDALGILGHIWWFLWDILVAVRGLVGSLWRFMDAFWKQCVALVCTLGGLWYTFGVLWDVLGTRYWLLGTGHWRSFSNHVWQLCLPTPSLLKTRYTQIVFEWFKGGTGVIAGRPALLTFLGYFGSSLGHFRYFEGHFGCCCFFFGRTLDDLGIPVREQCETTVSCSF